MQEIPPSSPEPHKRETVKRTAKPLALAMAFIAVEVLGIAGLVLAPRLDLVNVALVAVSGAMIVVPILFAIALRTSGRK